MPVIHLEVRGQIGADGHLHVDVPTSLPPGTADVAITIRAADSNGNGKYDFSDLVGRLEWRGDAVAEQRMIRDEW
jgi:hypothetical protein